MNLALWMVVVLSRGGHPIVEGVANFVARFLLCLATVRRMAANFARLPNQRDLTVSVRMSAVLADAVIALLGNYMAMSFVTAADGHGGTLITEAAQTANQLVPLTTPHTG
jgi:hypothetical protein